jgi:hypothetical protein
MVFALQEPPVAAFDPKKVEARIVKEPELRGLGFSKAWEFPRFKADGRPFPGKTFEDSCFKLARQPLISASGSTPALWLGDLLKDLDREKWSKLASQRALGKIKGKVAGKDFERLEDMLTAYDLYSSKWNPRKSKYKHGMYFGDTWEFKESEWSYAKADREVEQIAQLVVADIAAIKATEADYQGYWHHVKHDWERIEVVPKSLMVVLDDADKHKMSSCEIDFEFDLPFPFSTAEFKMHTLNRMQENGSPILYLFATGDDVHWLAGYDVYEPVVDRDGNWVGTMMIRVFGLDLDGVPDGRGDRHDNLRGQFGNLRRGAERLFGSRNRGKGKIDVFPYKGELPITTVRDGRRN